MRWLINYMRSCFCKHEWDEGRLKEVYMFSNDEEPCAAYIVYTCKKCKYSKKVR